ncbi:YdeI/OmpD-associated family protein [Longivirga aurantiaca]|uniref:YdeI family protein n=1 Tax=Longivirga aurantiaca TaxID=1837743 RepID=A0ABW1T1B4_9ACTN
MAEEEALSFAIAADFAAWISARSGPDGVWLRVPMKASGHPGIGYAEALQVALAHGWIDGQRKGDDGSGYWLQRFTPRRARSRWSQVNCAHAEKLIAEGRMTPAGLAEVEAAKADGRWAAAYAPQSRAEVPPSLAAAFDATPGAREAFEALDSRNRFAVLHRAASPKTDRGRLAAAERLATMLARGDKPYP